ncbi:hypothetical protein A5708_24790 [Mycobacterium colombiense]|uniref:Uncharacterized protein n=1 Tax=Mycobacterium colombiense TaxID=339268 RepID=A0A1A2YSB1_9MYCO|nr:hypothetical protein A5708_24790 [Mycobacterium colombiense]
MKTGQRLWREAAQQVLGGGGLLSAGREAQQCAAQADSVVQRCSTSFPALCATLSDFQTPRGCPWPGGTFGPSSAMRAHALLLFVGGVVS